MSLPRIDASPHVSVVDSQLWRRSTTTLALAYLLLGAGAAALRFHGGVFSAGMLVRPDSLLAPATMSYLAFLIPSFGCVFYTISVWLSPGSATTSTTANWLSMAMVFLFLTFAMGSLEHSASASSCLIVAAISLACGFHYLETDRQRRLSEQFLIDIPLGFGVGFSCVAAIAGWASLWEFASFINKPTRGAIAVGTLVLLMAAGMVLSATMHGRWSVTLGFLWGIFGIMWGGATGFRLRTMISILAFLAFMVVLSANVAISGRLTMQAREARLSRQGNFWAS